MNQPIWFVVIGIAVGLLSGALGLGGGLVVIPMLIYIFGFSQHMAQGTSLAMMVPPIGLLAAWAYYRKGYVDMSAALFLCFGFFIGGLFGGMAATSISAPVLKRAFGVLMLAVSLKMIFGK